MNGEIYGFCELRQDLEANDIPLVATDIYAHRQALDYSVAFLTEPELEAFARGIVTALTQEEERAKRIVAARRLYASKYSREAYVAKKRDLLTRIS